MSQRAKHVHKKKRSKLKRERQWLQDFPDKLLYSGVWPWLAQVCAKPEDVASNQQSEDAACIVHRAFRPPRCQVAVRPHRGESQDEVGRLSHGRQRIPLDDAQFLPFARGKGSDPAN